MCHKIVTNKLNLLNNTVQFSPKMKLNTKEEKDTIALYIVRITKQTNSQSHFYVSQFMILNNYFDEVQRVIQLQVRN